MLGEAIETARMDMRAIVDWIQLGIEAAGVLLVVFGVVLVIILSIGSRLPAPVPPTEIFGIRRIRLTLSKYLTLALEFLLAADIVATVVAPTWDELGRLAAIALIRTFLNYFLEREIEELGQRKEPTVFDEAAPDTERADTSDE